MHTAGTKPACSIFAGLSATRYTYGPPFTHRHCTEAVWVRHGKTNVAKVVDIPESIKKRI